MTTTAQAQRLSLVAVVAAGAVGTVAAFAEGGGPTVRQAIGLGASALILTIGAEVAPTLAAGFAVLLLTSTLFVNGGATWDALRGATSKETKP